MCSAIGLQCQGQICDDNYDVMMMLMMTMLMILMMLMKKEQEGEDNTDDADDTDDTDDADDADDADDTDDADNTSELHIIHAPDASPNTYQLLDLGLLPCNIHIVATRVLKEFSCVRDK